MKLYTEEQVRQMLFDLGDILFNNCQNGIHEGEPELYFDNIIVNKTPIELPSDEHINKLAEREFPFPTDVVSKKNELIITKGLKPFNHAKIEKYRRIWAQGYKKAKQINQMEKFNAAWDKRLSKEEGKNIIHNGERLGESESDKDTYWSVYKLNEQYFITLNDEPDSVWIASEEDAINYYNQNK